MKISWETRFFLRKRQYKNLAARLIYAAATETRENLKHRGFGINRIPPWKKGYQRHLVVCGMPRAGSTLLHFIAAYCLKDIMPWDGPNHVTDKPALTPEVIKAHHKWPRNVILTKQNVDLYNVDRIRRVLHNVRFLCIWRDPREVMSSKHMRSPEEIEHGLRTGHQKLEDFRKEDQEAYHKYIEQKKEYGFEMRELRLPVYDTVKDWVFRADQTSWVHVDPVEYVRRWAEIQKHRGEPDFVEIRYKDLVTNPSMVEEQIREAGIEILHPFKDFHKHIPDVVVRSIGPHSTEEISGTPKRPLDPSTTEKWKRPENRERVERIMQEYPALQDALDDYETTAGK